MQRAGSQAARAMAALRRNHTDEETPEPQREAEPQACCSASSRRATARLPFVMALARQRSQGRGRLW